jgi:hypothetical protein
MDDTHEDDLHSLVSFNRRSPSGELMYRGSDEFFIEPDVAAMIQSHLNACRSLERKQPTVKVATLTDGLYAGYIAMRTLPLEVYQACAPTADAPLPITSINEDKLLRELSVSRIDRSQIEGLTKSKGKGGKHSPEAHKKLLSSRALLQLAADPPAEVGRMQRRSTQWLIRVYPLGARCRASNSPWPCRLHFPAAVTATRARTTLDCTLAVPITAPDLLLPPHVRSRAPLRRQACASPGATLRPVLRGWRARRTLG